MGTVAKTKNDLPAYLYRLPKILVYNNIVKTDLQLNTTIFFKDAHSKRLVIHNKFYVHLYSAEQIIIHVVFV